MGMLVYGRKVRETATEVAYTFGADPSEPDGVLVIPFSDVDAWHIEDATTGKKPMTAQSIAGRAYLKYAETGAWPDDASMYS